MNEHLSLYYIHSDACIYITMHVVDFLEILKQTVHILKNLLHVIVRNEAYTTEYTIRRENSA